MIEFQESLHVSKSAKYCSIGVIPEIEEVEGGEAFLWKGISVEVDHDDNATPCEIIERAQATVRDLLTLVGAGRGLVVPLRIIRISVLSPDDLAKVTSIARANADAVIVRQLVAMPSEELLTRLAGDPQLRRQLECLNMATVNADVVSRITWAYKVLEQRA